MKQRGQAQLYAIGGVAVAMLLMLVAIGHYRSALLVCEANYESFKSQQAALSAQAEVFKVKQETFDAKQIQDARGERDAALDKLRKSAGSGSRKLSTAPAAPAGSSQVCFGANSYTSAFGQFGKDLERFMGETRGIAAEGDAAQIDAQALVKAWPKPINP